MIQHQVGADELRPGGSVSGRAALFSHPSHLVPKRSEFVHEWYCAYWLILDVAAPVLYLPLT